MKKMERLLGRSHRLAMLHTFFPSIEIDVARGSAIKIALHALLTCQTVLQW